jgi:hypothetical protein
VRALRGVNALGRRPPGADSILWKARRRRTSRIPSLRQLLIAYLVSQQLTFGLPARAAIDIEAGKPLDAGALSGLSTRPFDVGPVPDLYRGDARLSLPLRVPPGTGGLTPALSLVYGSGQGDGPLGVGWSLQLGFPPSIERSTRNGAPAYTDADSYEMGGLRLRQTATLQVYTLERTDHSRIEYVAAGDYWRVLRTDGTRLYYGFHEGDGANQSVLRSEPVRAVAPIAADCPSESPFTNCTLKREIVPAGIGFAWYLDRVEDRNGNVIRLDWTDQGDPGARY